MHFCRRHESPPIRMPYPHHNKAVYVRIVEQVSHTPHTHARFLFRLCELHRSRASHDFLSMSHAIHKARRRTWWFPRDASPHSPQPTARQPELPLASAFVGLISPRPQLAAATPNTATRRLAARHGDPPRGRPSGRGDRGRGDGDRGSSGGAVLDTQTSPSSPKCSSTKDDSASNTSSVMPGALARSASECTLHV